MARAALPDPSDVYPRTRPLSLDEVQARLEAHEGRLDADLDDVTPTAGTVEASKLVKVDANKAVSGLFFPNVARTATADGTTTGTIAAGAGTLQVVVVTCDDANKIIVLPAPVVGLIVVLVGPTANGYELRSSDPATIGINGGTGAGAESAIPAATTAIMVCETLTNWKGFQMSSAAGTLAKVEVAA